MKTAVIFGFGYSGGYIGRALEREGYKVVPAMRNVNMEVPNAVAFDDESAVCEALECAAVIIVTAPPSETGDPVLARYREEIASNSRAKVIYLSTTAVYGDHGGDWVDENTVLAPKSPRAHHRIAAETAWRTLPNTVLILRLAGIYGANRGPFQKLRDGRARRIIKEGQVFSRIHVEDIAGATVALLDADITRSEVYNLCDDLPAPPQDVIAYAADLLNLPLPPLESFETAALTPMARSFYLENKRVRNGKIKRDAGFVLKYPDYKSGLAAVLQEEARVETRLEAQEKTR